MRFFVVPEVKIWFKRAPTVIRKGVAPMMQSVSAQPLVNPTTMPEMPVQRLSVTAPAFSPSDRSMASVSRLIFAESSV